MRVRVKLRSFAFIRTGHVNTKTQVPVTLSVMPPRYFTKRTTLCKLSSLIGPPVFKCSSRLEEMAIAVNVGEHNGEHSFQRKDEQHLHRHHLAQSQYRSAPETVLPILHHLMETPIRPFAFGATFTSGAAKTPYPQSNNFSSFDRNQCPLHLQFLGLNFTNCAVR